MKLRFVYLGVFSAEPIGTIVFNVQSIADWGANILNAGQTVFGLKVYINIFSIIVKLGLLITAFINVAKVIDEKLDIA